MQSLSRREFVASTLVGVSTLATVGGRSWAAGPGWVMGCQSYSFRKFSFEDSIKNLKELGLEHMEFCAVHFLTGAAREGLSQVKATIEAAKIRVPCYGVEGFSADVEANRRKFEFGKYMGIGILTADPEPESFDNLEKLCEEYKIKIAIHNHGPKARYDKVSDTLKAVEGKSAMIGACVDTGHVIRSGEKPHEVIRALGARVHSLHLKDWRHGGEEQILGEGDMDLGEVAKALRELHFTGPIMMEYENSPENPLPDMKKGLANWLAASA